MALRRQGWWVSGTDRDPPERRRALELGAIDEVGMDTGAAVTFIAVPAGAVAGIATAVLSQQDSQFCGAGTAERASTGRTGLRVVTDVAGTKEGIVNAVRHPRFVGGHPMAGSEQEGVDGADPELFLGATWVLTPSEHTSGDAYSQVQAIVRLLGANPVAVEPASPRRAGRPGLAHPPPHRRRPHEPGRGRRRFGRHPPAPGRRAASGT